MEENDKGYHVAALYQCPYCIAALNQPLYEQLYVHLIFSRALCSRKEQVYIQLLLEWLIQCCYGVGALIQGQRRGSLQQFLPWKVTPGEGGAPTLVWLRNLAHEVEYRTAFVDKNTATRACYAVLAIAQLGLMTYMREDLKPMKVIQNDLALTEQMPLLL